MNQDNFNFKCYSLSEKVRSKLNTMELKDTSSLVTQIQAKIIDKCITPFLNEILSDIYVEMKVGLISCLDLTAEWNKDWGKVVYMFYVGDKQKWQNKLSATFHSNYDSPWKKRRRVKEKIEDRNTKLKNREVYLERIFAQNNITAKILKQERGESDGIINLGEIVYKSSREGSSHSPEFQKKFPWALVSPKVDFPMVYIGIFEYDKPLGFLQLNIKKWWQNSQARPSPDNGEFSNCYKKENKVSEILNKVCYFESIPFLVEIL